jgi:hypothetical protein
VVIFIERHGIVCFDSIETPFGKFAGFAVNYVNDTVVIRHVDENAGPLLFQLERFGVTAAAFEVLADVHFRCRINHGNAADDSYIHPFRCLIIPKVVRIRFFANRDTFAKCPRLSVINVDYAGCCVGHEELVEFRNEQYALRLV